LGGSYRAFEGFLQQFAEGPWLAWLPHAGCDTGDKPGGESESVSSWKVDTVEEFPDDEFDLPDDEVAARCCESRVVGVTCFREATDDGGALALSEGGGRHPGAPRVVS
jgi:hypothetical protein